MASLSRLVPWIRRRRAEREIRRELALHLALETRQNRERGMRPTEGGAGRARRPRQRASRPDSRWRCSSSPWPSRAASCGSPPSIMPLADRLSLSVARPRFAAAVLGAFALVSLLLATAGLYGAVSFAVARRRHELGVRSALGAGRGALIRLLVGDGLRVTGVGLVLGPAAAGLVATPLRSMPAARPASHRRRTRARASSRLTTHPAS